MGTLSRRVAAGIPPDGGRQLRGGLALTPAGLSPASRQRLIWANGYQFVVTGAPPGAETVVVRSPEHMGIIGVTGPGAAPERDISGLVNGYYVSFDTAPIVQNIGEALGADVHWEPESGTAYLLFEDAVIRLKAGDRKVYINDREVVLDEPVRVVGGRLIVPVRFLGELRESSVDWDSETQTVTILQSGVAPEQLRRAIEELTRLWVSHLRTQATPLPESMMARAHVPEIVDQAYQVYWVSQNYLDLALSSLHFARKLLDRGAYELAADYLNRAREYEKMSYDFYETARDLLRRGKLMGWALTIQKGVELGLGILAAPFGLVGKGAVTSYKVYVNYLVDRYWREADVDEARWDAATTAVVDIAAWGFFQVPAVKQFMEHLGQSVTGYIGRDSGLYQALQPLIKSPEVKAEMMRIIADSSEWALLKAANKDVELLLKLVVEHFGEDLPDGGGGSW